MVMMMYSLILRDWEKGGEVGVDPIGCLRLLYPRPHLVRELMPLTSERNSWRSSMMGMWQRKDSEFS